MLIGSCNQSSTQIIHLTNSSKHNNQTTMQAFRVLSVLVLAALVAAMCICQTTHAKDLKKPVERYCSKFMMMDDTGRTWEQMCDECCKNEAGPGGRKWDHARVVSMYCYCSIDSPTCPTGQKC